MEAFLTTLPPYVHVFLDKHSPTETFNILRELICFAVLYSNDRQHILSLSKELIDKGADSVKESETTPTSTADQTLSSKQDLPLPPPKADDDVLDTKPTIDEKNNQSGSSDEQIVPDHTPIQEPVRKKTLPWTFPEWWGHQESDHVPVRNGATKKEISIGTRSPSPSPSAPVTVPVTVPEKLERPIPKPRAALAASIPWEEKPVQQSFTENCGIPNLRSYLVRSQTTKSTTGNRKGPVQQTIDTSRASRRMSAPIYDSPVSTTPPRTQSGSSSLKSSDRPSSTVSRSSSAYRPKQTATVRARLEHAKQQQQLLEEQKRKEAMNNKVPKSKYNVRSSINWDHVKQERRKTLPATPVSTDKTTNK